MSNDAAFWMRVYDEARTTGRPLSGFFNRNYLWTSDEEQLAVIVRVPVGGHDMFEPRMYAESDVLKSIQSSGINAPRLLWTNNSPQFQVHEYSPGTPMLEKWPRGVPVPTHFIADAVTTMKQLESIDPPDPLHSAGPWGQLQDNRDFLVSFIAWQRKSLSDCRKRFNHFYKWINMPDDPYIIFENAPNYIQARQLRLCHGDMHRFNCLINSGKTVFLDWELALLADPLWDISAHIHRMQYFPEEEQEFLNSAKRLLDHATADTIDRDIRTFFSFECIKEIANGAFRYLSTIQSGRASPKWVKLMASEYAWKLALAAEFLPVRRRTEGEILKYFGSVTPVTQS